MERERYSRKLGERPEKDAEVLRTTYEVFNKHLGDIIPDTEIELGKGGLRIEQKVESDRKLRPISDLTGPEIAKYREVAMGQFFELVNVKLPAIREEIAELGMDKRIDIDVLHNIRESRMADNVLVDLESGRLVLTGLFGVEREKKDETPTLFRPVRRILRSLYDAASRGGGWELLGRGKTRLSIEIPPGEKDIIALTYDDFPSENSPDLLEVLSGAEENYRKHLGERLDELQRLAEKTENEFDLQAIHKEMEFLGKKSEQGIKVTFFMNRGNMEVLGEEKTMHLTEEVLKRGHFIANHETGQFPGQVFGYYSGHGGLAEMERVLSGLKEKYPEYASQILPKLVRRSGVHFTKYFEDEKEKLEMVELLANPISLTGMHASETRPDLLFRIAKMCTDQGSVLIWHIGKTEDTKIGEKGDLEPGVLKKSDMPKGKRFYPEVHVEATRKFLGWYINQNGKFAPTTGEYIPELRQ